MLRCGRETGTDNLAPDDFLSQAATDTDRLLLVTILIHTQAQEHRHQVCINFLTAHPQVARSNVDRLLLYFLSHLNRQQVHTLTSPNCIARWPNFTGTCQPTACCKSTASHQALLASCHRHSSRNPRGRPRLRWLVSTIAADMSNDTVNGNTSDLWK